MFSLLYIRSVKVSCTCDVRNQCGPVKLHCRLPDYFTRVHRRPTVSKSEAKEQTIGVDWRSAPNVSDPAWGTCSHSSRPITVSSASV